MSRRDDVVGRRDGEPGEHDGVVGEHGGEPRRDDLLLRVVGGLVAVAGALVTAVVEAFLTPLRVDTARLPVSLVIAVVANVALVWFTYQVTGKRAAVVLPILVWFVVMLGWAGRRTAEGDLLLTGDNWVGQLTIFGGAVAFGLGAYRLILPRPADGSRSANRSQAPGGSHASGGSHPEDRRGG